MLYGIARISRRQCPAALLYTMPGIAAMHWTCKNSWHNPAHPSPQNKSTPPKRYARMIKFAGLSRLLGVTRRSGLLGPGCCRARWHMAATPHHYTDAAAWRSGLRGIAACRNCTGGTGGRILSAARAKDGAARKEGPILNPPRCRAAAVRGVRRAPHGGSSISNSHCTNYTPLIFVLGANF